MITRVFVNITLKGAAVNEVEGARGGGDGGEREDGRESERRRRGGGAGV